MASSSSAVSRASSSSAKSKAYRRFEREQANALWQGDMLVGPYLPDADRPGKYRRSALFCFIDDYSRLIPYGEFLFEESLPRLERVLKVAILRRGIPQSLYVDNGKVKKLGTISFAQALRLSGGDEQSGKE